MTKLSRNIYLILNCTETRAQLIADWIEEQIQANGQSSGNIDYDTLKRLAELGDKWITQNDEIQEMKRRFATAVSVHQ